MNLTVVDNPEMRRFEARTDDGEVAGVVEYERTDDTVTLVHTEVVETFHGQGVGSRLVRGTLHTLTGEAARVVNDCPFIERFLLRHEGEFPSVERVSGP
jgi:predicted GNAT family acetyltransferase